MQSTSRTEQRCRLKRPHAGRDAAERVLRLWADRPQPWPLQQVSALLLVEVTVLSEVLHH